MRTVRTIAVTSVEVLGYVAISVLVVIVMVSGVRSTADSWDATHGGEVGTFQPVTQSCSSSRWGLAGPCDWSGTWTSDDGERAVHDVLLDDDLGTRRGDDAPAPVHPVLYSAKVTDPTWSTCPATGPGSSLPC